MLHNLHFDSRDIAAWLSLPIGPDPAFSILQPQRLLTLEKQRPEPIQKRWAGGRSCWEVRLVVGQPLK